MGLGVLGFWGLGRRVCAWGGVGKKSKFKGRKLGSAKVLMTVLRLMASGTRLLPQMLY